MILAFSDDLLIVKKWKFNRLLVTETQLRGKALFGLTLGFPVGKAHFRLIYLNPHSIVSQVIPVNCVRMAVVQFCT